MSALEILDDCEVKKKKLSYQALYKGQKMSGIYPAQTFKENVVRWIKTSSLDSKDIAPPKIISDASRVSKRQKQ